MCGEASRGLVSAYLQAFKCLLVECECSNHFFQMFVQDYQCRNLFHQLRIEEMIPTPAEVPLRRSLE